MSAILDYMRLCRLCLVKDKVNVPIFGDTSDVRQIFLKISACLPVKVSQDDNLPKSICDTCLYKVDLLYQFWNTTVNAEKQLIQWLAEIGVDVNIKTPNPPQLRIVPQSHAHPHSMPEAIVLKEERQDPDMKAMEHSGQNFHMDHQNMYSGFEMPYPPQVNMTVGAPTDFTQPTDAPAEEEVKVPQQKPQPTQPTPAKRRGRPPKQKTPPSSAPVATTVTVSAAPTTSNSKRRSSAAAAAAAVAAAAANVSSDESDFDDRTGADDSDDEDMDIRIAKEEADSDDEEYVDNPESLEPTTFVGVPSTSACDSEQPGPSGLGGSTTTAKTSSALPANAANETGLTRHHTVPFSWFQDPMKVEALYDLSSDNPQNTYCSICCRDFSTRRQYKMHFRIHLPKIYPCGQCGKKFRHAFEVRMHEARHVAVADVLCDLCDKKFLTKFNLELHKRRCHDKDYSHICEQCDRGFYCNSELKTHQDVVHRGMRFICKVCHKEFKSTFSLSVHVKIHDSDYMIQQFKCEHCDKIYESLKSMKRHVLKVHENSLSSQFVCDICGKSVATASSLRDHKRRHTGEKPYICSFCGKNFSTQKYLTVHTRVHTHEKPYPCDECGRAFSQPGSLTVHKRLHSGERPYPCPICNKRFVTNATLKLHVKTHGFTLESPNKE